MPKDVASPAIWPERPEWRAARLARQVDRPAQLAASMATWDHAVAARRAARLAENERRLGRRVSLDRGSLQRRELPETTFLTCRCGAVGIGRPETTFICPQCRADRQPRPTQSRRPAPREQMVLQPGDTVRAADRANFGTIRFIRGDEAEVYFLNREVYERTGGLHGQAWVMVPLAMLKKVR